MTKYSKLRMFLENTPAHVSKVILSFDQIDMILKEAGRNNKLPFSARTHHQFWENQKDLSLRPQTKAWHDAGFAVSKINLTAQWIEFER